LDADPGILWMNFTTVLSGSATVWKYAG